MNEIFNRNHTAKHKYRPDLLPTVNRPGKPSDETLNTRDNFEACDMAAFQADPLTYQFATYEYDEDTVIMTQDDFLRFMTLAYTRLRLGQFMVGDFSFADVDTQTLELIKGRRRDAFAQTE